MSAGLTAAPPQGVAVAPVDPLLSTFNSNTRVGQLLRKRGLHGKHASLMGSTTGENGAVSPAPPPLDTSTRSNATNHATGRSDGGPSSSEDDEEAVKEFAVAIDAELQPPIDDATSSAVKPQSPKSAFSRRSPRKGSRMPCKSDLEQMLPEVRATIEEHAINIMKLLLYPKVFARCRRRQQANASLAALRNATRLTPQMLRGLYKGFQPWPDETLAALITKFRFEHFDVRSYVVHAGEPSAGGAYIIVSGTVSIINPWTGSRKTASAPIAIGVNSMLDGTPHTATYITATRTDAWHIYNDDFLAVFHTLPAAAAERTIAIAFEAINRKLLEEHPMSVDIMKRSPIFAACPVSVLQELVRFTVPYCVPRQHVLCQAGTPAQRIVFPLMGRCNVVPVDRPAYPLQQDAVFGEDAVLTSGKHNESLVTVTELHCYVLRKTLFDSAIRVIVEVPEALHAAFRMQRERQIDKSRALWSSLLARPPLVGDLVDEAECAASLSRLCVPRVYSPMTVICSSGQYCTCVIVVLTGTIRIGDGDAFPRLTRGSYAGYTGIIKHRWGAAAVSETLVETLEIPIDLYTAWLRDHNILAEVKARTLRLMFPKAFPRQEATAVTTLLDRGALGLHPVSNSRVLSRAHTAFVAAVGSAGTDFGQTSSSSAFLSTLDTTALTSLDGFEAIEALSPVPHAGLDVTAASTTLPRVTVTPAVSTKSRRTATPLVTIASRPASPALRALGAVSAFGGAGSRPTSTATLDRPLLFSNRVSVTPTPYAKTADDDDDGGDGGRSPRKLNAPPRSGANLNDRSSLPPAASRPATRQSVGQGGTKASAAASGLNRMTKASNGMWIRRS